MTNIKYLLYINIKKKALYKGAGLWRLENEAVALTIR